MKVTRRRGRPRLRLDPPEIELLELLFNELETVVDGTDEAVDDAVVDRLFPAAYPEDERAETEFRSLTLDSLRSERQERLAACRADLALGGDIDLADDDTGRRWIQVVNDLRLALGTRLGITEDDEPELDPADPQTQPRLVYYWLTALQDSVVQALMG